jgi:hypothetical protein
MRWVGHVKHISGIRNIYKASVENPYGKRPLGGPWWRWENNIKMDLKDIGWESMD